MSFFVTQCDSRSYTGWHSKTQSKQKYDSYKITGFLVVAGMWFGSCL